VPVGAGLSSSAALEVSVAASLLAVAGTRMPLEQVARLCQRAENEFVGAPCGIMDQFVAALGRAGQALFLDCRNLHYEYVPLPEGVSLVLCNSMVKHSVATGEYGVRRRQCEEAVRLLSRELPGIAALRDVSCRELQERAQQLPALLLKRARHVISENQRVQDTVEALRRGNLAKVGELMEASHASMRDDFEISCPEIDVLVELAQQQPATIGTRMTGGGFGGCTVNLVRADGVDSFRSAIHEGYTRRVGREPQIYVTQAGDGVERIL
jgi:galactokinase